MHPMVLRPVFLPGNIWSASGNGGGVLVGYMTHVPDPRDLSDRKTRDTFEFAKFKMEVYQRVLEVIFSSLKLRLWNGELLECWDKLVCVFHPRIHILSLDRKEAAYFNACRAALANYPCPKCLVQHCKLHKLTKTFKLRTTATMKAIVLKAHRVTTKTVKEELLKNHRLHGIKHFLWGFCFSDPYAVYLYDTLHSDDLGKWGDHLWDFLLEVLEEFEGKGLFAKNMRKFARWPGLKHFNEVTTIRFTDGQSFYDILKSVLPCIVQLLPHNSELVHCIWVCQQVWIMTGMHCMPSSRLEHLGLFIIQEYEKCCSRMSKKYGKDFDFFKQHATSHIIEDIHCKGTTNHGSTRPGEGFQQEAAKAYNQTNFKNAASQLDRIDETQEAIARIRMVIDKYNKQHEEDEQEEEPELDDAPKLSQINSASWRFGAPGRLFNSGTFKKYLDSIGHPVHEFHLLLCDFITKQFPDDRVSYEQRIQDWRSLRDIIRCNPLFHGHTRFDSLLFNSDSPGMAFARIYVLLCCTLESKRQFDIALVREYRRSNWKPRTKWAGCQVHEEVNSYSLMLMDYVIRGALLTPATDGGKENLHFLVDTVDPDMFLRANQS
ncbi:hypothetical protein DFH08DRAFT_867079 [Mycena albidolilacea]|uniref:Transposase n=1 Tax=Mycena albidolilacea TaxID=1033008 RepID=A0AAD7ER51_9AGAR|nr:hypothetical protein DFH08DRAFT_867079 [Mycena albidolilacea]